MTYARDRSTPVRLARAAGWLYLVIIVCGIGGEAMVRSPMVDMSDPVRTVANLRTADTAFRLSIGLDVVMAMSDVAVAVLLYALFEPAGHVLSLAAMAFRLVQATVLGLNLLNLHQAVTLASESTLEAQRGQLVMLFLDAHAMGYDFWLFFFGINCLLTAILIRRSGLLPRGLGLMLMGAGVVYLVGGTVHLVLPTAVDAFAPAYALPLVAELSFCLLLIVRGVAPGTPTGRTAPDLPTSPRSHPAATCS